MAIPPMVLEVPLDQAPWQEIQPLLDDCYPQAPRDVFERVLASTSHRKRLWLARDGDALSGLVMLSPHSKGGHLDNLAVAPHARGKGIGQNLVQALLQAVSNEGPALVSLTTRIPSFFSPFGFQPSGKLADGAVVMLIILPGYVS